MRRELFRLSLPFRQPFLTSNGAVTARELLLLRVEEDGVAGYGEAAPFAPYDGVEIERVVDALLDRGPSLPQAEAAEEMARLDLAARAEGRSLAEPGPDILPVNATLGAGPPDESARAAVEAIRRGYACLKLKVGLPDDVARVAAVREAIGPWPGLRLDANGAWTVDEAIGRIAALAEHDLELIEQPCATLEELAEVRALAAGVPIAADEPIRTAGDVRRAVELGACDAVCVKLAPSGGIGPAREALRTAAEAGLAGIVSSTLDGPWGIAAAVQLAANEGVMLACGLATLELFDSPLARVLRPPAGGTLSVPRGPGLGVEVPEELLREAVVEQLA